MQFDKNEKLDLTRLFDTIKKWWWIVVAIILVSIAVSIVLNFYYLKNVYEASTTLYSGTLSKSSITSLLQELQVGENVIQDYREIVKSRLIVEETKRLLQEDAKDNPKLSAVASLPYESFSSKVSVGLLKDTHIMKITVSDSDPQVCMLVANKIAGVFTEKVKKITKIDNIQIIDEAVKSEIPVKPDKKKNMMSFFAIGLVTGLGIISLIHFFDKTIKTTDDVIELLELPVIGVVREFDTKVVEK
jgi:capsular polysaccharide biosynthesis protein